MKTGRNDPCPCGSGKKYKLCHYDSVREVPAPRRRSKLHDLDERVTSRILEFVSEQYRDLVREVVEALMTYPGVEPEFVPPWVAWVDDFAGRKSAAELFLESRPKLRADERAWIEAQRASWLSIHQVVDLERGRSLSLVDLLTGRERVVEEVAASETAEPLQMMLCRVVDFEGSSVLVGTHSLPLAPRFGHAAVATVRKKLRRKNLIDPERLRDGRVAWKLLSAWSDEVDRAMVAPLVQDSEGDPIIATLDEWNFPAEDRAAIVERISAISGIKTSPLDGEFVLVTGGSMEASIRVGPKEATVETLSVARSKRTRELLEAQCGGLLRNHRHSERDIISEAWEAAASPKPRPVATHEMPRQEEEAAALEWKEQYYARWIDDSIPALDGMTPRECAKTKRGRAKVEMLLDDFEYRESGVATSARYDFGKLREMLGMKKG